MIDELQHLERISMVEILSRPNSEFTSLDIDYHPPRVERIQIVYAGYKLSFHVIHECGPGESLYHPHPWESAIHVVDGAYEMGLSHHPNYEGAMDPATMKEVVANQVCRLQVERGMYYEMLNPMGWHYVRPFSKLSHSVMLTGKLWHKGAKATTELKQLSNNRVSEIKEYFLNYYKTFNR